MILLIVADRNESKISVEELRKTARILQAIQF